MILWRGFRLLALTSVVVAVSAACSVPEAAAPPSQGDHLSVSRTHSFTSLHELSEYSGVVAIATATPQSVIQVVNRVPFTVTTLDVVRVVDGNAPTRLRLQQVGTAEAATAELPIVAAGRTYLLFAKPFIRRPGEPPVAADLFVPVGVAAGLFIQDNDVFRRLDPLSTSLPAQIPVANLEVALLK